MCGLRTLATLPGKVRYLIESRTEAVIHFEPDGRRPACLNADAGVVFISCGRGDCFSRAPLLHPFSCCGVSQDHPLLPATVQSWTNFALLHSTTLPRGPHRPCRLS